MKRYIAHSKNDKGDYHYLQDHLISTAKFAAKFANKWGAGNLLYYLGLIHDAGKFSDEFQAYLKTQTGRVDHSSVGALLALKISEPLSFIIAGHHGGLPDREEIKSRIKRKKETREINNNIKRFNENIPQLDININLPKFSNELSYEFFIRMCFSALVDADFLDTENHFESGKSALRNQKLPSVKELWDIFRIDQNRLLEKAENTDLNTIRKDIYYHVIGQAKSPSGFYSLTVPTGGGKTRTGLGFALKHAVFNDRDRVIVVVPYTNIIEQTADVYRKILGKDTVLEHHSVLDPDKETEKLRLAAENWDMPIIVTTSVQFFESLFASKTSRCRKLHNIARSVVIFDEVQTVPPELLEPIISVLKELKEHYGVTIVFSTATQPAFKKREGFNGLDSIKELAPEPVKLFQKLKRVNYQIILENPLSWNTVANRMLKEKQALAIVNTKDDARILFKLLDSSPLSNNVFHLSTNMCPEHRRKILKKVKSKLDNDEQCYLVSTQLIEAGVDIDFPLVLRALAPLDSIVQSAGRCNREGKLENGKVIVFEPEKSKLPRGVYATATAKARLYLEDPKLLHEPEVFHNYFNSLYRDVNLDRSAIQDLRRNFDYKKVGKRFKIIPDDSVSVIIDNFSDGQLPVSIRGIKKKGFVSREEWRLLQPYTVSFKKYKLDELIKEDLVVELAEGLYIWAGKYDSNIGIEVEGYSADDFVV